jgi:prolyl oligopeptidase
MGIVMTGSISPAADRFTPPPTRTDDVVDEVHGDRIPDPYRWLEDQQAPETRAWIETQNKFTAEYLSAFPGRAALARRCAELLKVDGMSAPAVRGGNYFFTKRAADQDLPVIAMRKGREGDDVVLVDPRSLSTDGSRTVSILEISKDGSLLIYGVRQGGEDEVALHFLDVASGKPAADPLPKGRYFGLSLTEDKSTLYFTLHDKTTGGRVMKLAFGSPIEKAETLFGEGYDPGVITSPILSENGEWLVLLVSYGSAAPRTDIYFQNLKTPGSKITPLVNDVEARFEPHPIDNRVVIQTNWNAPNNRVIVADLSRPDIRTAPEIIAESKTAVIDDISLVGGRLYVNFLENVVSKVRVFDLAGKPIRDIAFPTLGAVSRVSGEWDGDEAYYSFSSFATPSTILRETVSTGEQSNWFVPSVPIDSTQFELSQVFVTSKDGTKVPMFIGHRKGLVLNGDNPTLLYGYGGFNISLTPSYSPRFALWLDQGGVFAVANLRGGGEFGEDWHRGGMLDRKQNVFDDFHAAAEYLIANKYTQPSRLGIAGGSNGGLLVGTAMTQRPELFRAVVCSYPLLDMVRYHKFLVARFWIPEYGSSDDPAQYKVLRAYSPYHNVKPGTAYPATLFITGDADTRVDPLHARKMAALVQAAQGGEHPILLKYDTKLGHTGARPISATIEDYADEIGFLLMQLRDGGRLPPRRVPAVEQAVEADGTAQTDEARKLHDLFAAEWERGLKESPTFASHLGDYRYNSLWTDVSLAAIERRVEIARLVLAALASINREKLSASDKLNYDLFQRSYALDVEGHQYGWYLVPLTARDGIQDESQLADALRFESVRDYEDWLARLERLPTLIEQTTALMREGIRRRILQPKVVMQRVPRQIKAQIVDDPEKSLYYKPFRRFASSVSAEDQRRIAAEARKVIAEKVVPAYRNFAAFFEGEYLPACYDEVGCWQAPRGDEFYSYRCRYFTSTNLTPEQIHEIGLSEVKRIRGEMDKVIAEAGFKGTFAQFTEMLRTDPRFYYKDANELLAAYRELCKQVDPQLPKLFKTLPRTPYGIEPIPEHIAPDTTTAYYRQPAADGTRPGTYFVNLYRPETRPKYEMEALSLHEAVPGHHLQIALAAELENVPEFRKYLENTVFVEGWALYSESLGPDLGLYRDPYSKFGQLTYEIWRAIRLVVDTGIHSKKWTRQQAIDYFKANSAKSELDIVNEIDRYIAWPGQALAYKIGELKIKELRKQAEQELGSRFDVRTFHDVVLLSGAVPLDILEANVHAWIADELRNL